MYNIEFHLKNISTELSNLNKNMKFLIDTVNNFRPIKITEHITTHNDNVSHQGFKIDNFKIDENTIINSIKKKG